VSAGAMDNVGKKYFKDPNLLPINIYSMGQQTGIFWYDEVNLDVIGMEQKLRSTYRPIEPLDGGTKKAIEDFEMRVNSGYEQLSNLIIDKVSSAQAPDKKMPVKTTEMLQETTNDTLKDIQGGLISLKDNLCNNIAIRAQLLIAATPESEYDNDTCGFKNILTKKEYLAIKAAGKYFPAQYNVRIKTSMSENIKQQILLTAQRMTMGGKNGKIALQPHEYLFVVDRLEHGGQIKEIIAYLAYKKQKEQQHEEQYAQATLKQNQEGGMALQQQKDKSEKELIILKALLEKDNILTKYKAETMSKIAIDQKKAEADIMKEFVLEPDSMAELKSLMGIQNTQGQTAPQGQQSTPVQQ
jgi:hypothetical protein